MTSAPHPESSPASGTTLGAAYRGDRAVVVAETPVPPLRPDEVRIAVSYVGLCGTDLHIFQGHMDARVRTPLVFGHEMSGVVEAVGASVTEWAPGDAVTVMPLAWDGTCPACRAGQQHICQNLDFIGIDSPGALQGLWTVHRSHVVALPEGLSLKTAALVEPVAVAAHDVRRGEVCAGDRVVVVGGGPIGLLIATVAADRGADVIVLELDAARRALLERTGLATLDPGVEDAGVRIEEWTDGAGADVVFEVSGAAAAVKGCFAFAKVRGTVVIVAIHPSPREVDLQRVFWRELRILGARVYQREDFETAIGLLDRGAIPAEAMISEVVPLGEVQSALDRLESGGSMKVLVDVAGIQPS